jgi:hypothetical protein
MNNTLCVVCASVRVVSVLCGSCSETRLSQARIHLPSPRHFFFQTPGVLLLRGENGRKVE